MAQATICPTPEFSPETVAIPDFPQYWLYVLFFLSGFPALIYQIVWQRALFTIYGVNVESVTVVVTAFMLGLGLGSLAGGRLSRSRLPLVLVFAGAELCTAAYGLYSLYLFQQAAQFTSGASTVLTGVCAFALIVTPTVLMGSTLPILVAYLIKRVPNTGRAAGVLYFVNTLGSATACFVAGRFTMRLLGMSGSVRLAAGINAAVALSALAAWIFLPKRPPAEESGPFDTAEEISRTRALPLSAGIAAAAFSGFIALGFEIVWYRVFDWASATNPKTFAYLLGAYLAGLALGALMVERRCRWNRSAASDLWFAGVMLVGGNIMALLVPSVLADALHLASRDYAQLMALVWVACSAGMLGTTFPMICHLTVRPGDSAGEGVSFLYVSNILGSTAGSLIAGYLLSEVFSLLIISAVLAAAGIVLGLAFIRQSALTRRLHELDGSENGMALDAPLLPASAGMACVAAGGFITLSCGMLFFRPLLPASNASAFTLPLLLGVYLTIWVFGALGAERRCRLLGASRKLLWLTGILFVAANVIAVLVAPIFSLIAQASSRNLAYLVAAGLVGSCAAILGNTVPMVSCLAAPARGSTFARARPFYRAFAEGCVAGILCIGFVDIPLPSRDLLLWVAAVGLVLGFVLIFRSGVHSGSAAVINVLAGAGILVLLTPLPQQTYENLFYSNGGVFSRLVENRHGVIAVEGDNRTVIGGGIYDGMFNLDPMIDSNFIKRCYSLFGFLSRPPKRVLMIGLSSGSWGQVLVNHPETESLEVVEINPGYLKLIPEHPEVASILHNPKVSIFIDDGHRWLLRNPQARFDLIVMNTTFYWRANATNLLSRQFLELARRHLEPGGTLFYNTTWSPEALFTAASVFPYAVRILDFIAVSDSPLRFDEEHWRKTMTAYRINGAPVIDLSRQADQAFLDKIATDAQRSFHESFAAQHASYFEYEASLRSRFAGRTVVTDDNMAVEWRDGKR